MSAGIVNLATFGSCLGYLSRFYGMRGPPGVGAGEGDAQSRGSGEASPAVPPEGEGAARVGGVVAEQVVGARGVLIVTCPQKVQNKHVDLTCPLQV